MEKVEIEEKFLQQAKLIGRDAQILPDGIEGLALKLQKASKTNTALRIKLGLDPTRPDLHLGHTVVMRKLKLFQKFGHEIILIVGGATAMIGDPSGKSETRPSLTKEQVEENAKTYFEQMSKVLDVEKATVVNNADWLHKLNMMELLQLASKVTVAQIMARDDFSKRYQKGLPIALHEFFYPLMQSYDSVEVQSDIELGGNDQRFNLLLGREIQLAYGNKNPQSAMLLPLLEGTDGVIKMSKTYPENCISLTESPKNMYGKVMSIPDELIVRYYSLLTDINDENLSKIEKRLETENPRNIKMELAFDITSLYCGENEAKVAQEEFINVVQKKQIPSDISQYELKESKNICELLFELNFVKSKSEAKRLIKENAVKLDGLRITDINYVIEKCDRSKILQSGKRNYVKII